MSPAAPMTGRLKNKIAIVTGAGSGIGEGTAAILARDGASVVVADIDEDAARRVSDGLRGNGLSAIAAGVDVGDEAQIEAMIKTAVYEFGGLDVLHNNAADTSVATMSRDTSVVDVDAAILARILRINAAGYALAAKHAIPHMLERGGGVIINTSSIAAFRGELVRPMYAMAKGAIEALTRSIATQYGRQGIRAVGVAPGVIASPAVLANELEATLDAFKRHNLVARLGRPEDIGQAVAFLASDEAGYITGVTLVVDGGMTTHFPSWADDLEGSARFVQ